MANVYIPRNEDSDNLKEFPVSKSDPKYQTLPYNTKFTVNLLTANKNLKNEPNTNDKEDNNYLANLVSNNNNNVIQAAHMMVHSAPLSQVNKNMATPLNQHDLLSRKTSEGKESNLFAPNNKEEFVLRSSKFLTENSSMVQKPISSVAPTSIHHANIPSTVYQTSSIKVQPIEPQNTLLPGGGGQVQSPLGALLSPPQSSSTPITGTPEVSQGDTTPKPALPPKPAIKPPPRLTQTFNETEPIRPPPLPLSEPPEDKTSPPLAAKPPPVIPPPKPSSTDSKCVVNTPVSSSEMIIKAKPLNFKKQPIGELPKLRNLNSKQLLNGRRLESGLTSQVSIF